MKKLISVLSLLVFASCNTNLIYSHKSICLCSSDNNTVNIHGSEVKDAAKGNSQKADGTITATK